MTSDGTGRQMLVMAAATEMLELLKELEWAYGDDRYDNVCAVCDRLKTEGHAADCKLGNLLKRLES